MKMEQVPAALAVVNIHPDYIEDCIEACCTGSPQVGRLQPGTIAFIRQTTGSLHHRQYGVVGIWAYTGRSEPVARREGGWPTRWDKRFLFEPLVKRFSAIWSEDFSVRPAPAEGAHNQSSYIHGLTSIMVQGRIKNPLLAVAYINAVMKERRSELKGEAVYMGHSVTIWDLLMTLTKRIAESNTKQCALHSRT